MLDFSKISLENLDLLDAAKKGDVDALSGQLNKPGVDKNFQDKVPDCLLLHPIFYFT